MLLYFESLEETPCWYPVQLHHNKRVFPIIYDYFKVCYMHKPKAKSKGLQGQVPDYNGHGLLLYMNMYFFNVTLQWE